MINSKLKVKPIQIIDWMKLESFLGTKEYDPEGIVHELAHVYDCIGKKAFDGPIGKQHDVSRLIEQSYDKQSALDRAEIRVSAITFLVLQPLGYANINDIIDSMRGNLSRSWFEKHGDVNHQDTRLKANDASLTKFMEFVRHHNETRLDSTCIRNFLLENFTVPT